MNTETTLTYASSTPAPRPNMQRFFSSLLLAISMVATVGCNIEADPVNRVQENLVDKGIFEGEWWTLQSVVDADGDAVSIGAAASIYMFPGGSAFTDLALDSGQSAAIGRIRWVIDEDFLYAYRSYELIDGGNDDGRDEGFRGQPLAAFAIEEHVDVRHEYSALTGERTNVIVENTTDRRWYERDFIRVDWSMNHSQSFAFITDYIQDLNSSWRHESAAFIAEPGALGSEFPNSFAPQFVRVQEDPDYRFADEWPADMADAVHYMSFTTLTMFSPGESCLFIGGGPCQTLAVPVRTAFLRVPPNHTYAAAVQNHPEFDRFGLFRTYQRTYVRGGQPVEEQGLFCGSDAHCGDLVEASSCTTSDECGFGSLCECPAGADCADGGMRCYDMQRGRSCNMEVNSCSGGLTSDYGETDLLTFYRPKHNFFRESLTEQTCIADWQCSGIYGTGGEVGSSCDRSARRCTIPLASRELRPVAYHLNDAFPKHLVKTAFETMGNWNEVFMRGWRAARGLTVPDYTAVTMSPQTDNPTAHCFAGSPDVLPSGNCRAEFDPFISPDEWAAMGVVEPYDCQVVNVGGFEEPARPTSYDEYPIPGAYQWEFQGEECMFILKSNACDLNRTEEGQHCDEVVDANGDPVRWEQQGDIRYQFFNYIDEVSTLFGGVSELRSDPISGELITADANFGGVVAENITMVANEWLPVLRCLGDAGCAAGEEGAADRWVAGDSMREYYSNLGNTELPIRIAPSGGIGIGTDDPGRPAIEFAVGSARAEAFMETVHRALPKIERLHGTEGRAQIYSDRMRNLEGTSIERQLMGALGGESLVNSLGSTSQQTTAFTGLEDPMSEAMLDQTSPFRGNTAIQNRMRDQSINHQAGLVGYDFAELTDPRSFLRSRYWEYWAEAFRDRPLGEASIRLQQMQMKSVQHHEIGHSVGLRHNFGGSFDRNNYGDGYFNLALREGDRLELPRMEDFDENGDDFVGAEELDAYYAELRRVRNERARLGMHNYMTGSIMDYNGDLSDVSGLGRYDIAATVWNYFDQVEAYVGEPRDNPAIDPIFAPIHRTHETPRVWQSHYSGGESCIVDTDCPSNRVNVPGQEITQRCVRHPRYTRLPEPCGTDRNCICSNYDEDFKDYFDGVAYNNDITGPDGDPDGVRDFYPVSYMFGPDERAVDISWCSRFDAGESFQEAVDHFRRNWYERYAASYHRRFLARGPSMAASFGSVIDTAKMYQHLFFRLFFEPGFGSNAGPNSGPLGFDDQFAASVDGMNWLIELANLPDEGSYALNEAGTVYEHMGSDADMPGSDFTLGAGQGYGTWTQYQDGHQGFFRAERSGVFWDKFYALYALAIRDWNLSFTLDERYFINYYDLFGIPMTEFFGGIAIDEPTWYAPRVTMEAGEPVVNNMSWYRGLALGECRQGSSAVPCLGPQEEVYPEPALGGSSNVVLRSWATILALAQFPVFYDSSFEQRLIIFRKGDGTGHTIPDVQPNGDPACGLGEALRAGHNVVDPDVANGCDTPEDATYVVYNSDRLHTPYVAVKVRPRLAYNLEEEQLGFQLLKHLIERRDAIRDGTPTDDELRDLMQQESFLEYLIQLQAEYGISNSLGV